jgi:predicted PurR-regulated permease PerM
MKAVRRKADERSAAERDAQRLIDLQEARAVIIAAAVLAVFLYFIKLILLPFLLPAVLAYICTPLIDRLASRTRWPRWVFAVLFFLAFLGIGGLFAVFAGERFMFEARNLASDLQGTLERFVRDALGDQPVRLLGNTVDAHQLVAGVLERLRDWIVQSDMLVVLAGYSVAAMMGVFLTLVLLFYFLISGHRIARGIFWMVPPHRRALANRIWKRLDPVLTRYFVGMIVVMSYATAASYVGLKYFLNVEHAGLLALLTGVLETVPVVGPTSAAIVAGLVSLRTATGIMSIIDYALYAVALRLSIDQLIGPFVLGTAAHVHPVLIIFCFLTGGIVFGIPGVILAVPVALLIRSTLATLYGEESDEAAST